MSNNSLIKLSNCGVVSEFATILMNLRGFVPATWLRLSAIDFVNREQRCEATYMMFDDACISCWPVCHGMRVLQSLRCGCVVAHRSICGTTDPIYLGRGSPILKGEHCHACSRDRKGGWVECGSFSSSGVPLPLRKWFVYFLFFGLHGVLALSILLKTTWKS